MQYWGNESDYVRVRLDSRTGSDYAYWAVKCGETLDAVPMLEDTNTIRFLGWYYENSGEPFDISQPIYEDTQICAKWESTAERRLGQIAKLAPLGCISVIFLVVLVIEYKRNWMKR